MKTSWFQAAAVAGVLVASGASAQETGDAARVKFSGERQKPTLQPVRWAQRPCAPAR